MNAHERTLLLAATALDFELDETERAAVANHVGSCRTCRRTMADLSADAVTIAGLPRPRLAAGHSDAILGSVLRRTTRQSPVRYLLVAALLGLLAAGTIVVGAQVLRNLQPAPLLVVQPSPSARPAPSPAASFDPVACVAAPSAEQLVAIGPHGAECYGSAELSLVGYIPLGDGSQVCEGWEPKWLACPSGSFIAARAGRDAPLLAYAHPAEVPVSRPSSGPGAASDSPINGFYARFTGHFDDPAAADCRATGAGVPFSDDPDGLRRQCRETLVVTALDVLGQADVPKPVIDATWTEIAGREAFGSPELTELVAVVEVRGTLYALSRSQAAADVVSFRLWTSVDGAAWSEVVSDGFVPTGLGTDGDRLFGIGEVATNDIRVSSDGRAWQSLPGLEADSEPTRVTATSLGTFATGGVGLDAAIWRLFEERWQRVGLPDAAGVQGGQDAAPARVEGVADIGGRLVAWGEAPPPSGVGYGATRLWTSVDGSIWERATDPPTPGSVIPRAALAGGDGVSSVVVGSNVETGLQAGWVDRGGGWEVASFFGATDVGRAELNRLIEIDGTRIAVGYADGLTRERPLRTLIWGSTDGASWWPLQANGLDNGIAEDVIVTTDGRTLAVGRRFVSTAQQSWNSPHYPAVYELLSAP